MLLAGSFLPGSSCAGWEMEASARLIFCLRISVVHIDMLTNHEAVLVRQCLDFLGHASMVEMRDTAFPMRVSYIHSYHIKSIYLRRGKTVMNKDLGLQILRINGHAIVSKEHVSLHSFNELRVAAAEQKGGAGMV